jgi:hypothetical protein
MISATINGITPALTLEIQLSMSRMISMPREGSVRVGNVILVWKQTCRCCDAFPEVIGDAVGVQFLLEVQRYTLQKQILADVVRKHA